MRTAPLIAGVALLLGGILAGCATAPAGTGSAAPSAPATPTSVPGLEPAVAELDAAWLDGGRMIGLVTQGSSTCVPTALVDSSTDGALAVTLVDDPDSACTRDMVPRVTLVEVPEGLDPSQDLAITATGAGYEGEVTLPGVEGLTGGGASDQLPSAGWTSTEGDFVVLLWGSSGCPETLTSIEVTGDAAVEATLSGIPADTVCTADMAANPSLGFASGLVGVEGVELTLIAPEAEPFTTPILGVNTASDSMDAG